MRASKHLHIILTITAVGLLLIACENPTGSGGGDDGGSGNGGGTNNVSIDTESAADVGNYTATLQGNLADLGQKDSVDVAFQYREAGVSDWGDSAQVTETALQTLSEAGSFNGDFSADIAGLTGDTQGETEYEFRAVAYDGADLIAAGDAVSFLTSGPGHTDRVLAVATDGTYLYTASDDTTVHKVDISGPEPSRVWIYEGHSEAVTEIAVHPNSGNLYTGSEEGGSGKAEIHIIDPTGASPTPINTYTPRPGGEIRDLVFDGNDLYLAAGEIDKVDTSDNQNLTEPWDDHYNPTQNANVPQALTVDPNNNVIYAAAGDGFDNGGELHRIVDVDTSMPDVDWTEGGALQRIRAVTAVNESGSTFLYTGADDASLRRYDAGVSTGLGNEEWSQEYFAWNNVTSIVLDGSGNVISGSYGSFDGGQVRKSDPSDGTEEWLYSEHEDYVYDVAVVAAGDIYSASASSEVHRIDSGTGDKVWHYR